MFLRRNKENYLFSSNTHLICFSEVLLYGLVCHLCMACELLQIKFMLCYGVLRDMYTCEKRTFLSSGDGGQVFLSLFQFVSPVHHQSSDCQTFLLQKRRNTTS